MNAYKIHGPQENSRLILLAEDHPLNQKVALLLLERMGFAAHVVNNGAQAVAANAKTEYDAILMDCHMPEMDGFDATRAIRHHEQNTGKHVPIIAVTALAMAGDRERCLSAGMDDYITKPIDRELLQQKLVYWMSPGTVEAIRTPSKVVQLHDKAFTLVEGQDEPLDITQFFDSYGDDAVELLQVFLLASDRLVEDLREAIKSDNLQHVAKTAHEIKGSSWAVGADELARLAVFLEQAAGQENRRLVQRTYSRLIHHFDEVKKFVRSRLDSELQAAQT